MSAAAIVDSLAKRGDVSTSGCLRWITASTGPRVRFVTVDRVCRFPPAGPPR